MAANEERCPSWRTPFSTPVRRNENGSQDSFQHLEKLLASAVSICRLKGSLECQAGGLITVCEEMQRLLRFAFSENSRLEKELKKQRTNHNEDVNFLKERVTSLENDKDQATLTIQTLIKRMKAFDNYERFTALPKTQDSHSQSAQAYAVNDSETYTDSMEYSDPNLFSISSQNVINSLTAANEEEVSQETDSTKSASESQDMASKKSSEIVDGEPSQLSRKKSGDVTISDSSAVNIAVPVSKSRRNSSKASAAKARSTCKPGNSVGKTRKLSSKGVTASEKQVHTTDDSSKGESLSRPNVVKSSKTGIKAKKNPSKDTHTDDSEAETSNNTSTSPRPRKGSLLKSKKSPKAFAEVKTTPGCLESEKGTESESDLFQAKSKKKGGTKGAKQSGKRKSSFEEVERTIEAQDEEGEFHQTETLNSSKHLENDHKMEAETSTSIEETPKSHVHKSKSPITSEKNKSKLAVEEESLGDMSFLIEVSSQLAAFVSDTIEEDLELPLMTGRERSDIYKLASLFNLHPRIGTKLESRSTLRVSKLPATRMPRPGKIDSLLSKLSIAATKEAEKASPKIRAKRKLSSAEGDGEFEAEQPQPGKKGLRGLSKSKKAKV